MDAFAEDHTDEYAKSISLIQIVRQHVPALRHELTSMKLKRAERQHFFEIFHNIGCFIDYKVNRGLR